MHPAVPQHWPQHPLFSFTFFFTILLLHRIFSFTDTGALPPAVQNVLDVLAAKENVGEELAHAGALARQLAPRVATAQQLMRHSGGQVELNKHGVLGCVRVYMCVHVYEGV